MIQGRNGGGEVWADRKEQSGSCLGSEKGLFD